jgi:hypothetical protein
VSRGVTRCDPEDRNYSGHAARSGGEMMVEPGRLCHLGRHIEFVFFVAEDCANVEVTGGWENQIQNLK